MPCTVTWPATTTSGASRPRASRWPAWSVDDAPRTFIEGQLRAIVGLELRITRIEAKAKLSQNRPATDIAGVVAGLAARGDDRSAEAVKRANRDRAASQDHTEESRAGTRPRSGN